jgi:hypothetical protein
MTRHDEFAHPLAYPVFSAKRGVHELLYALRRQLFAVGAKLLAV